jgi:hypothetical protein
MQPLVIGKQPAGNLGPAVGMCRAASNQKKGEETSPFFLFSC